MISLQSGHGKKEVLMKNTLKLIGIIAITAITALAMIGCPNGTTGFTVTFDSQGGSSVAQITGVTSGTTITTPTPDPTRSGHTFGGWFKEAVCTNAWNFGSDTVTSNITLYAKWTADTYTVSFDSQGGSSVDPISGISSGATITRPTPDPTRSGHTFDGWFKEVACTNPWNFETDTVTSTITLYAKWVSPFEGTWISNFVENTRIYIFNGNNFTLTINGNNSVKGTFEYTDTELTLTITDVWSNGAWTSEWDPESIPPNPTVCSYTISGNELSLTFLYNDNIEILTKQ